MRPRKKVVIYCKDIEQSKQIAFILNCRKYLDCSFVCDLSEASALELADLILVIMLDHSKQETFEHLEKSCSKPIVFWRKSKGLGMASLIEAVANALVKKRGPSSTLPLPPLRLRMDKSSMKHLELRAAV